VRARAIWFAVGLLAVWAMKRYYADASADDLRWILGPAARLAGGVAGASFVVEPGAGYLSRERLFLVEKSCAGLNFMIAAFAMLAFALRQRVRSVATGAIVLGASLLTAYAAAVIVNAARIAIAFRLVSGAHTWLGLTSAQSHRVEGILVYFCGLVLLHELVLRVQRGPVSARSRT
jgi:exosortase K